jgi:hypothetical protein
MSARGADVHITRIALPRILPRLEMPAARWADQHPAREQVFAVGTLGHAATVGEGGQIAFAMGGTALVHKCGEVWIYDA